VILYYTIYQRSIRSIRYRILPARTVISTVSPLRRPRRAFPIGEAIDILPRLGSTSRGSTII
jgi:hypothetical protein